MSRLLQQLLQRKRCEGMLVAGISTTASGPRSADVARMAREAHEADQSVVVLAAESRHECDETRTGKVNAVVGSAARVELVLKWQKYRENHMGHTGTGPIGSSNAPPSIGGLMFELQPTFVSVDMELIRKSLAIAEDAKEFAQELLTRHDDELGRTTKKNKMWADQLEKSIAQTVSGISELRKALGITV